MKKTYKLKRIWCFVLGFITALLLIKIVDIATTRIDNWFKECDQVYGYTTDYYTCRNYYISK